MVDDLVNQSSNIGMKTVEVSVDIIKALANAIIAANESHQKHKEIKNEQELLRLRRENIENGTSDIDLMDPTTQKDYITVPDEELANAFEKGLEDAGIPYKKMGDDFYVHANHSSMAHSIFEESSKQLNESAEMSQTETNEEKAEINEKAEDLSETAPKETPEAEADNEEKTVSEPESKEKMTEGHNDKEEIQEESREETHQEEPKEMSQSETKKEISDKEVSDTLEKNLDKADIPYEKNGNKYKCYGNPEKITDVIGKTATETAAVKRLEVEHPDAAQKRDKIISQKKEPLNQTISRYKDKAEKINEARMEDIANTIENVAKKDKGIAR